VIFALDAGVISALASVIVVDLVLAGDNAIAVAMAASGLPSARRRHVIAVGTALATALRIALALIAARLLAIVGLTLAGGLLLLFVAWKLFRELRRQKGGSYVESATTPAKSFGAALFQVLAADVSMSIDNVLAVAGTARDHVVVLAIGLLLSVALMAGASSLLAQLMARHAWINWVGLAIVTIVALRLIHDGGLEVISTALRL
jgi:YjbE family integral membrane protein